MRLYRTTADVALPLFRFVRRAAAWEEDRTVDQIIEIEFRTRDGNVDLRPSVYAVEQDAELIQACAEHTTICDPKRPTLALNCTTDRPVEMTPGSLSFEFTRERHREILLKDRADLAGLVKTLKGERTRHVRVTEAEVTSYVTARIEREDPEWIAAATADNAKKWVRRFRVAIGKQNTQDCKDAAGAQQ